ncbi:hypothetical protein SYK_11840 [Pseudodesulfovibrio nedwellii]|uniref:Uncharacterized protein n=1 Tax=Pseudodesulfovibrio nedwellii TaxID=2973072 RepID=A0ABM8AZ69_9BACT|nr:hypothetical protein [Pseudodesulfovibrio nedwellii]BDQ36824.1 hypothetical protein SYK_11840 [Pseudodesulfovibrio nedwellii]
MAPVNRFSDFQFRFGKRTRTIAMTPEKYVNDEESEFLKTERGRFILTHMKALYDEVVDRLKQGSLEEVSEQMVSSYRNWSGYEMTGYEILNAVNEVADEGYREKYDACLKDSPQPLENIAWETNQEEVIRTIVSIAAM